MNPREAHIASFIVQTRPDYFDSILHFVETVSCITTPAYDNQLGKIIVVLETSSQSEMKNAISNIEQKTGVLSVIMVYHQVDLVEKDLKEAI